MRRREFIGAGLSGLLLAGVGTPAVAALSAGKEYLVLGQPLASESGGKIEVLEFFWYGCPHCYDLEPLLGRWQAKKPADVELRKVPAIFRDSWVPGAKTFYTLESLGLLGRLHGPVFDAIHKERLPLHEEKVLFDWMEKKGVDRKKFQETYGSFGVQGKVARAQQLTRASRIEGVPAMIVEGRWLVNNNAAASHEAVLGVVDQLIEQARTERAKKK